MIDPLDPGTFELRLPAQPLSNTERQRRLRQERNKAGIKPVYVSPAERELLGKALRLFGRVSFSPERAQGDVVALLGRVQPDGPQGQALDDFALLEVGDADLQPHWDGYRSDFARAATALGVLRLRNNQHAELARAVSVLQGHLRDAGLEDQADVGQWYWNKTPLRDYRAETAPEHMERQSAGRSVFDQRDELARRVADLKGDIERLTTAKDRAIDDYWRSRDELTALRQENAELKAGLQEIAAEFAGTSVPQVKVESAPQPAALAVQAAGVLDLSQLNEGELELLKSALSEHHEKNKSVLWKDVACENLWRRLSLLQLDRMAPQADPFTLWGGDPVWSKSALQSVAVEARQELAEGPGRPVLTDCERRNLATFCNNKNVKIVRLRSYSEGVRNEFLGDVVRMCAECRKANNGGFKIIKGGA